MFDDDRPAPTPKPIALDALSIEDLEERVVRLRREIAECERIIEQKRSVRSAADALFGTGAA